MKFRVVRYKIGLAGLRNDGLADADLVDVKVKDVAIQVHSRAADHGIVELELPDGLCRKATHQTAIGPAQGATRHNDFAFWIAIQDVGHIDIVGHHHDVAMLQKFPRYGFGTGPDIQEYRGIRRQSDGAGPADGAFGSIIQAAPFLVPDIGGARGQNCSAMHPGQCPRIGKFGQIPPYGLQCDIKMLGQSIHSDLAGPAGDLQDFGFAKGAGHTQYLGGEWGM